jgi:hypothetical protein
MGLLTKENKIKVLITEDEKGRFKHMLEQFQYLIRDIDATPLEINSPQDYYCIISIPRRTKFVLVVEVLALNGFNVISHEPIVKAVLDKVKERYREELAYYASEVEIKKSVNKTHDSLDKLAQEGSYKELIGICKDITYSPDTITKARASVSRAVTNAIIKIINDVSTYKLSVDNGAKSLLSIASDDHLKPFNCSDLMIEAANVAFELCTKNADVLKNLIKFSNQKFNNSIINLKAAAKFAEIAFSDESKYDSQIRYAVKELNIRWLLNLIEPLREKISEEENELIEILIKRTQEFFK